MSSSHALHACLSPANGTSAAIGTERDLTSDLPEEWRDDKRMAGFMSMFKLREVNPQDYDTKMIFWTDMIGRACRHHKDPVISLGTLKTWFRRGDRVPAGLNTVLEHMYSDGAVRPVDECLKDAEGWLSWGVNSLVAKPVSWLLGTGKPNLTTDQLVHMDTVKDMADRILDSHLSSSSVEDDDFLAGVVDYGQLRSTMKHICTTNLAFDLAVNQLIKTGAVTVGTSTSGERIVKFRDTREKGPVRLTETDSNLHDVRRAMNKLENDIVALEEKSKRYENEARVQLRGKNKTKAMHQLRLKQQTLKQIKEKEGQYDKLTTMLYSLSRTRDHKDVLDAMKAGAIAFKKGLAEHGLTPENIDETMEDISEALSDHDDITMAISQGPSGRLSADDAMNDELEQELNDLLAEGDDVTGREWPAVPAQEPAIVSPSERVPATSGNKRRLPEHATATSPGERDRLKELRMQLQQS